MKGAIHGIWLNQPGHSIHPAIIPKFAAMAPIAKNAQFHVVLWTNKDALTAQDQARLANTQIVVADPISCKNSPLYKYYEYFFKKGLRGDTSAFALASDILRIAILDHSAADKYFIYIDPNDIELLDLANNLQALDKQMQHNTFGYAFPVGRSIDRPDLFEVRNDVLIALKKNNPEFFATHLQAYWQNLDKRYKTYVKPKDYTQANQTVNTISNDTGPVFFRLERTDNMAGNIPQSVDVVTQDGNFKQDYTIVKSSTYLQYKRNLEDGNTWLPATAKLHQAGDHESLGLVYKTDGSTLKEPNSLISNKNVGVYALPIVVMLLAVIIYGRISALRKMKKST